MSRKLVKAIASLLKEADDDLAKYPDQESVAEAVLKLIAEHEKAEEEADITKKYLVVVGQTLFRGHTKPATVALGPFGGRAVGAAQKAGGSLSYDSQSHRMGRFMVVPMFKSAFEANKNFVADVEEDEEETTPLLSAMADASWHLSDQPACQCGLRFADYCHRHQKEL